MRGEALMCKTGRVEGSICMALKVACAYTLASPGGQ